MKGLRTVTILTICLILVVGLTETKFDYITVTDTPIYCSSQGIIQDDEYIGGVQVADLNNTSGPSPYSDFTYMTANMKAGSTVDVTLIPVFTDYIYTEYWKIWIDYNNDGDFEDAGEEVFSDYGTSVINGSITVQSGVDVVTQMRVSMSWGQFPPYCGTFSYGEVEDYTVNITKPAADFNNDGQEDILWRYYGAGGYNAVWLRGTAVPASVSGISSEKIKNNPGVVDMGNVKPGDEAGNAADEVDMNISIPELRKRGIKDRFEEYNIDEVDKLEPLIAPFDFYMKESKNGEAVSHTMESAVSDPRDEPEAVELPASVNTDWKLCGTGDFNADNKVDLVWRNVSNGNNAVWFMDGVTMTGFGWFPTTVNLDWTLCGIGDFNNDGKTDLLWRNVGNDNNAIWYMDGLIQIEVEFLTTVTDPTWKIEN